MATREQCETHLAVHPDADLTGKVIPADLLAAYLFIEHDHHRDETRCADGDKPYVDSMALYDFLLKYARKT